MLARPPCDTVALNGPVKLGMLVVSCHVMMCSCCGSHVSQQVLIIKGTLELRAAGAKHIAFVSAPRSALASFIIQRLCIVGLPTIVRVI